MKVGDLVTAAWAHGVERKAQQPVLGIVLCIDPEEIGDNEEVEVMWVKGWTDRSNHSTENLRVVSEQD
jgi:hypothetical protein